MCIRDRVSTEGWQMVGCGVLLACFDSGCTVLCHSTVQELAPRSKEAHAASVYRGMVMVARAVGAGVFTVLTFLVGPTAGCLSLAICAAIGGCCASLVDYEQGRLQAYNATADEEDALPIMKLSLIQI
eukprot:TRINITY_DN19043_c0_g1_i1.p1 TRINITY_DN19043_c0_g1~~TRINITY_DN19043_c0_g1_i1.p1  ORF type:complete len:128 (-),score=51.32 TRINITY_DN19043_c0_g1_i1:82-465(-)